MKRMIITASAITCADRNWVDMMNDSKSYVEFLDQVDSNVCNRLGACCNRKKDLPLLVDTQWAWMQHQGKDKEGFTKEDALVQMLEWLDSNGQWQLADLDSDEYDALAR